MDLSALKTLATPAGMEILKEAEALAPREVDFLFHFQTLARRYPPDLVRAALEVAILRLEGAAKFPFANRLYWIRSALEQASSHTVAAYRASRVAGYDLAVDLGCSAGADTLAFARQMSARTRAVFFEYPSASRLACASARRSGSKSRPMAVICLAKARVSAPAEHPRSTARS